jgi:PAS domain S-box-containing protein
MSTRRIAPIVLVLALTAAGFVLARAWGERDVDRAAERRANVAAADIQGRVAQGTDLVDSLRGFMVGHVSPGVTNKQFVDIGARWLAPAGLPAAAWVERVPRSARRETRLHATLATLVPPMTVRGLDLAAQPGFSEAATRADRGQGAVATRLGRLADGSLGLFFVQSAPRRTGTALESGLVALVVPASWFLEATRKSGSKPAVELRVGGVGAGDLGGATPARSVFSALGQRFDVRVPRGSVHGAAALLPWIILGAGFVLAGLAGILGVTRARRASAQREADRIFNLAPELIAVAGLDGSFKRVNPAFETLLGYTEEELLSRPLLDFVHPADRELTATHAARLRAGDSTVAFENRYACKDGGYRWLEWTLTPVPDEQVVYAVARDVTERKSLADELAASRARVVDAADDTRRRIERDLHDGTQQQLVSLGLSLRATVEKVPPELAEVRAELSATARGLVESAEDLRELSRGIHPAILSQGGLGPALKTLARRSAVPVELTLDVNGRLSERIEVAAYYVVSEALTNAAKHAHASEVTVDVAAAGSTITLVVRDDGVGGADPEGGSGLTGLRDRIEALGGTLTLTSVAGEGTSLWATVPLDGAGGST